jgi:dimethylargininase
MDAVVVASYAMSLFDYTHAIVRTPGGSVTSGLRDGDRPDPDYSALLEEHLAYTETLSSLGLTVELLPPEENFPDSIFVEDPALVFTEGAIVLNMAVQSRAGESALITPALERNFGQVLRMQGLGYADGGDVLVLRDRVLIGLSGRTNRDGAEELIRLLAQLGRTGEIAETPPGALHFKTGCSLIDEETIFALPQMADYQAFSGLRVVPVPAGEEKAANKLRIRDFALVGAHFPKSREIIEALGVRTIALDVEQIGRIDAGLSCMSLRWQKGA